MPNDKFMPLLKSVKQMQRISGLGEKKLRSMFENNEVDYIKNGNRYLLAEQAILNWYERNKVRALRKPSADNHT